MQISKRLAAVTAMVTPCPVFADIGTDHAYIPICLVRSGKTKKAIAMDVNRGPLARAQEHIRACGLEDQIETRLSDGLAALRPGEAACVMIAGMGGALTVRILREGAGRLEGCQELILQPQSEVAGVRAYLEESGWRIEAEDMVCEDGKYYPMMRAVRRTGEEKEQEQPGQTMSQMQLCFGPVLLEMRHPVLYEYLQREKMTLQRILLSLEQGAGVAARERREEIQVKLALANTALALYEK